MVCFDGFIAVGRGFMACSCRLIFCATRAASDTHFYELFVVPALRKQ